MFFKKYYLFILNCIFLLFYFSCPNFSAFVPLHTAPATHTPSGNPYTLVHVHGSCIYVLWLLYFLYCTVHPRDYSLTTNLYFLIPSPFLSPPSQLATIKMFSVSMILFLFNLFVYFVRSIKEVRSKSRPMHQDWKDRQANTESQLTEQKLMGRIFMGTSVRVGKIEV